MAGRDAGAAESEGDRRPLRHRRHLHRMDQPRRQPAAVHVRELRAADGRVQPLPAESRAGRREVGRDVAAAARAQPPVGHRLDHASDRRPVLARPIASARTTRA
jgi:hypothetical protein